MNKRNTDKRSTFLLYVCAWLIYVVFSFYAFPVISLSAMLVSIALVMLAAWLYGYAVCVLTTLLTIPFHYLILTYHSDDPSIWMEAFNPFGISTQLVIGGAVAVLKHAMRKIEMLNTDLEERIEERTKELKQLEHYIVQCHETTQVLLSHMLLDDIGDSLLDLLNKGNILTNRLAFGDDSASLRVAKLNDMINNSIEIVQNLEFVDHFLSDKQTGYKKALEEISGHFSETANVRFDLNIHVKTEELPKHIQHQLYRITQEAITNAVKHAGASNIKIILKEDDGAYRLSVINDGRPMPSKIESGLGLKLMQHRSQQLGGNLIWGTTYDGKTELSFSIPQTTD